MNGLEQFKEEMGQACFGRSPRLAKAAGQCVKCGEFNLEFNDELSRKEYGISGLCQCCQDLIFGENEEEHVDTYNEENLT